jgi:hypothetical protein
MVRAFGWEENATCRYGERDKPVLENSASFNCVQCGYCGYLILGGSAKELRDEEERHAIECKAAHGLIGAGTHCFGMPGLLADQETSRGMWRGSDVAVRSVLMLANYDPDRNIDYLTDTEIYAAIRYLEPGLTNAGQPDANDQDPTKDNGVVICACLYVGLLMCFVFLWFYGR